MEMTVDGIKVLYCGDLTSDEVEELAREEISEYNKEGVELAKIMLTPTEKEVIVETIPKSPIRRIRRITGYLTPIDNMNNAKRAEVGDRKPHFREVEQ